MMMIINEDVDDNEDVDNENVDVDDKGLIMVQYLHYNKRNCVTPHIPLRVLRCLGQPPH